MYRIYGQYFIDSMCMSDVILWDCNIQYDYQWGLRVFVNKYNICMNIIYAQYLIEGMWETIVKIHILLRFLLQLGLRASSEHF